MHEMDEATGGNLMKLDPGFGRYEKLLSLRSARVWELEKLWLQSHNCLEIWGANLAPRSAASGITIVLY